MNFVLSVYVYQDVMVSKYCPIQKVHHTKDGCTLCEKAQYSLKNSQGQKFLLKHDGGCHLRILNDQPLSLLSYIHLLKSANLSELRLDLTIEQKEDASKRIAAFKKGIEALYHLNLKPSHSHTLGRLLK